MKQKLLSIRCFDDIRTYLAHLKECYPGTRTPLSLEVLTKKLGYRSPRVLGMVINGQRPPSVHLARRLTTDLLLDSDEARFLDLLVEKRRLEILQKSTDKIESELSRLRLKPIKRATAACDEWEKLSDWHVFVIRQLIGTEGFSEDPAWIASRLRGNVSTAQIQEAILRLLELDLVRRTPEGRLESTGVGIFSKTDFSQDAVKKHQRQMLQLGAAAIARQEIENRETCSLTLQFDKKNIRAAQAMIRKFRDAFDEKFYVPKGRSVYQLNLQLFEHTREEPSLPR